MTVAEMKVRIQRRITDRVITEEDLISVLESPALDVVRLRDLWLLAKTGNEVHDKFRSAVFTVFRQRDAASKQEILEEYERAAGSPCQLTDFAIRGLIREVAERGEGETWVLKEAVP